MQVRISLISLALVCVLLAKLVAQGPPQPAGERADPRIDKLLTRWERETSQLQTMKVEVKRTVENRVFNRKEVMEGTAKFMRPDLASLRLRSRQFPEKEERFICTGSHIYNFRPNEKRIYVHSLPAKRTGQLPDEGALPFLFGMKAETAKTRYQFEIKKEDQNYHYVKVTPLWPRDQADFTFAVLSVYKGDGLPYHIYWFEPPNNNRVEWAIEKIDRNARLDRREFQRPNVPPGWQLQQVPNAAQAPPPPKPRVIRQQTPR